MSAPDLREGDLDAFFEAPRHAYGEGSPYVSPFKSDLKRFLDPRTNPLFKQSGARRFFTVHRGGRPIGRIVAHVHRASNQRYDLRRSYFGYFDCADDAEAARLLLTKAQEFGRAQGCDELAGNFNLTAMQQMGVLTEGFDDAPFTDQVWSAPHVASLLRQNGFEPFFPVRTFEVDLRNLDPDRLLGPRQREVLSDPLLTWSTLRRRGFAGQMRDACRILNEGFDRNPMFVPLTEEEFLFQAKDMMWIVDEHIGCMVREGNRAVGVVICIPDLNPFLLATGSRLSALTPWHFLKSRMNRRRAVIILYSVSPSHQNRGLNGAMLHKVTVALKAAGYESLGITWIADVNGASLRQVEKLGARTLHRLHLFRKNLA